MHSSAFHTTEQPLSAYLPWLLITLLLLIYLRATFYQIRMGKKWSRWRIFSFVSGCILLALGLTPHLMTLAHHDLRVHMIQHLLIGMFAPLGLVLGAPLTLALRTLSTSTARQFMRLLGSRVLRFISHPLSALLLNIGGMYVLYLTPLYAATLAYPFLHHLLHMHFLLAGYLFCWAIAGPDPAPHRPAMPVRLVVLFISMAAHAYLSKLMYAYHWLEDTPHTIHQIQEAAQLMYYGGDLAEVLLAITFFALWFRKSRSLQKITKRLSHAESFPATFS